ncbi:MAG: membrane protein insertion efficiency factor YidD [Clostridia bacterium]|nr:membrane protein insertion efficiency factor YidD [Clostridia bacterium]
MKSVALWLIRFYQRHISPYKPPSCKFVPTCSQYAVQALEEHGFWKGSCLAIWRILRCNPFSKGGYDPVPTKNTTGKP